MDYYFKPMMPFYSRFTSAHNEWLMSKDGYNLTAEAIKLCRIKYGDEEAKRFRDALIFAGCIFPWIAGHPIVPETPNRKVVMTEKEMLYRDVPHGMEWEYLHDSGGPRGLRARFLKLANGNSMSELGAEITIRPNAGVVLVGLSRRAAK